MHQLTHRPPRLAAGVELETRGPIDVATVHVTFQPGGSTAWHVHPGRRWSP